MPEDGPVEDPIPTAAPSGPAARAAREPATVPPTSAPASAPAAAPAAAPASAAFDGARTPVVRWFRRRPPAELDRFGRGVWWFGQVQLFLALAALPVGLVLILWGVVGAPPTSATGAVFLGITLVALPGPIAISGLILRSRARGLDSLEGARRWIALTGWVLLIALIASIAAIVAVFLTVFAFVVITGMAGGSF